MFCMNEIMTLSDILTNVMDDTLVPPFRPFMHDITSMSNHDNRKVIPNFVMKNVKELIASMWVGAPDRRPTATMALKKLENLNPFS